MSGKWWTWRCCSSLCVILATTLENTRYQIIPLHDDALARQLKTRFMFTLWKSDSVHDVDKPVNQVQKFNYWLDIVNCVNGVIFAMILYHVDGTLRCKLNCEKYSHLWKRIQVEIIVCKFVESEAIPAFDIYTTACLPNEVDLKETRVLSREDKTTRFVIKGISGFLHPVWHFSHNDNSHPFPMKRMWVFKFHLKLP